MVLSLTTLDLLWPTQAQSPDSAHAFNAWTRQTSDSRGVNRSAPFLSTSVLRHSPSYLVLFPSVLPNSSLPSMAISSVNQGSITNFDSGTVPIDFLKDAPRGSTKGPKSADGKGYISLLFCLNDGFMAIGSLAFKDPSLSGVSPLSFR
jgi:hypothetical protein